MYAVECVAVMWMRMWTVEEANAPGEFFAGSRSVLLDMIHRGMSSRTGVSPSLCQLDVPDKLAQKQLFEAHGPAHAASKPDSSYSGVRHKTGWHVINSLGGSHALILSFSGCSRVVVDTNKHFHSATTTRQQLSVTSGDPGYVNRPPQVGLGYLRIYHRVAA